MYEEPGFNTGFFFAVKYQVMSTIITCKTLFDITASGVRNNYKPERVPFQRDNGEIIRDKSTWDRARNQQRNWETINQIISLRCLPEDITQPRRQDDHWLFEFRLDNAAALTLDDHDVGQLLEDAHGVPMITNLDETSSVAPSIQCQGPQVNTWFWVKSN